MIYLVSNQKSLWESKLYEVINPQCALDMLWKLKKIGLDTETMGFDPYTKELLSLQLGCFDFQVVIDCATVNIQLFKELLESDILFIGWNLKFDGKFLMHQRILLNNVYDGFLAEKLKWMGYPAGMHGMSLKDAGHNYLNVELDKTVRGKIIKVGLTEEVILYAANDVKYLEPIMDKQLIDLAKQELLKAIEFENKFVIPLAYIEYCGVKLDVPRWKAKMKKDQEALDKYRTELNNWVETYFHEQGGITSGRCYIEQLICTYSPNKKQIQEVPKGAIPVRRVQVTLGEDWAVYKVPFDFVVQNNQGDLFSGFDTTPRCCINWESARQVIPFFELLGFKLETFDKATKKKKKSIDAKIIKPQKHVCSIAEIYLKYKAAQKVVSTYGQNFLDAINPVTGRIHPNLNQLGTDTGRLSSGGGEAAVNIQNLPHDPETRACFIAEPGNKWISADYQSQESRIIASVANDKAMIELFENGCGDVHSLVAKMAYADIIGDTPIEEIKEKFPTYRQDAKGIEFAVNYGGDANTIMNNKGIPLKEAERIYDNFMEGFPGVKQYQDYRRIDVMEKGYILLNPITKHKAYIYDYSELVKTYEKFQEEGFWNYYRDLKKSAPDSDTVQEVRRFFQRKSASEKQSINYPMNSQVVSEQNSFNSVNPVAQVVMISCMGIPSQAK